MSVLAPTVIGGLYWKRANRYAAAASIAAGEALVIGFYFEFFKAPGILPVVPVLFVTVIVFVLISLLTRADNENKEIVFSVGRAQLKWVPVFLIFFLLGNDYWAWGKKPVLFAGLPLWVWYYIALGIVLAIAYKIFLKYRFYNGKESDY
ncbi:hypothetical protein ES703_118952 [subsurface metagenome]